MKNMLASVRNYLSNFEEVDSRILEAMSKIDRKNFVTKELSIQAYLDTALPIEEGQTISQPSTVARMLSLLELEKGDKVLEIGTGSGWNSCLISFIVGSEGKVTSLEIYDELIEKAKLIINKLKIKNIEIINKNFLGIRERFDKIIFTAGISPGDEEIIEKFAEEILNEKGILVVPFRSGPLIIFKKEKGKIAKKYSDEEYVFVPLIL